MKRKIVLSLISMLFGFAGAAFALNASAGIGGLLGLFTTVPRSEAEIVDLSCFASLPDSNPKSCAAQKAGPKDVKVQVRYLHTVNNKKWIPLNGSVKFAATRFDFFQMGDMGCVYQTIVAPREVEQSDDMRNKYDNPLKPDTDVGKLFSHCVPLPSPDKTDDKSGWPTFAKYVSDACLYGCAEINGGPTCTVYKAMGNAGPLKDFYPSIFSVGVQCIEETLLRVFDAHSKDGAFQRMSTFLRPLVLGLMTISVILTGMRYSGVFFSPKHPGMARKDFMWLFMKLILVSVFSVGANMAFFFDAARIAQMGLMSLVLDLREGTLNLAQDLDDNDTFVPEGVSDDYSDLQPAVFNTKDYDYDFCRMRDGFDYSSITYTDVKGNPIPHTGALARYWDMLDCMFAQYMGVGWYTMEQSAGELTADVQALVSSHRIRKIQAPINIVYSLYLYLVPGIGWLIAAMAIVYTLFLFLLFARMFLLYLSYVAGLCLLFLFAPLFVVSCLFESTSKMFGTWRKYIISTVLHPLFFFLFLTIFLMILNRVYFGGNHHFIGTSGNGACASIGKKDNLYDPNKIMLQKKGNSCVCEDNNTLPCIYGTKAYIRRHKQQLGILLSFDFYFLNTPGMNLGQIFLSFGRLFVLFFAGYYVLQYVEKMAKSITSGIDALAGNINVKNPLQSLTKTATLAVTVGLGAIAALIALPLAAAGAAGVLGQAGARLGAQAGKALGKRTAKYLLRTRRGISAMKSLFGSESDSSNNSSGPNNNGQNNNGRNNNNGGGAGQ
ncbi:MAG: type IV secretion system protein [Rickettsiales bacterium]